ncbi:putative MFS family arabinose efflux permease [Kribbella amoyensis]|uniref:Putative MFS family arabinose efflux permease n=1 Tax=Kribbella amoyensis TaxID=996641 RepID=A0A561BJP1_9ACTN|nr:MFS transporter [Kribbella amoyensis]TWD79073.1 putative MFS family arabinose efflux permease [Kribbella amoyensis]
MEDATAPVRSRPTIPGRLRAVIAAASISSIGDGAWTAAVPLAAAAVTRDPLAVSLVSAAALLPWLVVSPLAGALVDRWPHRLTLIAADSIRGLTVALIALLVLVDEISVPVLAVGAFIVMAGAVFHGAAAQSVVADLTDHDADLRHRVNGSVSAAETAGASLIGPPAGSASFVLAPWLPFVADAVSFIGSAALLRAVPKQPPTTDEVTAPRESLRSAIWSGMTWLARHRQLRTLALLTGAANFTTTMVYALLVLYATGSDGLGLRDRDYGLLIAALAIGGIIGGPLSPRLLRRLDFHRAVIIAMSVRVLLWPLLALTSSAVVAGAALAVAGFASSVVTVSVVSARQHFTPRDMLGRVVTTFRTLGNGAGPLGALFGGIVASKWGIDACFWTAGGLMAICLVVASRTVLRRSSATK